MHLEQWRPRLLHVYERQALVLYRVVRKSPPEGITEPVGPCGRDVPGPSTIPLRRPWGRRDSSTKNRRNGGQGTAAACAVSGEGAVSGAMGDRARITSSNCLRTVSRE